VCSCRRSICTCQYFARPGGRGGGDGHTLGFRQKTIPDRQEFDKLMESGSRVHRLWPVFTSRDLMHQAGTRVGI